MKTTSFYSVMICLLGFTSMAQAQKFAYIDSDYVLLHMPEYSDAQKELNQLAIDWQVEIETKLLSVERMELAYRAERILLTAEMRAKREGEITTKRQEAKALQREKFGVDGELFLRRQELIQPVQDLIFEEMKDIASGSGYMVIFDKSNQSNMLYSNPKYDISDRLIKALGYAKPWKRMKTTKKRERASKTKRRMSWTKGVNRRKEPYAEEREA
ncbi:MAG: OmpH family outer membrane protein [Bacteroidetes bacterium]|nr:OmpH family outer membrane protein [Bacteroidota bacterium]